MPLPSYRLLDLHLTVFLSCFLLPTYFHLRRSRRSPLFIRFPLPLRHLLSFHLFPRRSSNTATDEQRKDEEMLCIHSSTRNGWRSIKQNWGPWRLQLPFIGFWDARLVFSFLAFLTFTSRTLECCVVYAIFRSLKSDLRCVPFESSWKQVAGLNSPPPLFFRYGT